MDQSVSFLLALVLLLIVVATRSAVLEAYCHVISTSTFVPRKFASNGCVHHASPRRLANQMQMRDASATYWFQVGDSVLVSSDVKKAGISLRDRVGTVVETWEKCHVDPTCCCAEQVERDMAVRVQFQGTEANSEAQGESFFHYFAEDELEKQPKQPPPVVAFDGMDCVAFKMDQIQASASDAARGIYSYDPSKSSAEPKENQIGNGNEQAEPTQQSPVAFDGMDCVAFKMDQIQSAASPTPRGIYSYDPSPPPTLSDEEN